MTYTIFTGVCKLYLHIAHRVAASSTFHSTESRQVSLEDIHLLHQCGESCLCGLTHLLINSFGLREIKEAPKHAQVFLRFKRNFRADILHSLTIFTAESEHQSQPLQQYIHSFIFIHSNCATEFLTLQQTLMSL